MRNLRGTASILLIALSLGTGCKNLSAAPRHPSDDPAFTATQTQRASGLDEDPAQPMSLYPGDVVAMQVISSETTEYAGLEIDAQGTLYVPLAGAVQVGGMTISDAEEAVQTAVRRFDTVARVALRITTARGHMATVLGAVATPGRVQLTPGMRVADLLAEAGGPNTLRRTDDAPPPARMDGAQLTRDGAALPIDLARAIQGDPRHNVRVRPGDHVYIPFAISEGVVVLGEVETAGVVMFRPGMRLTEALARSGGLTDDADRTEVHIIRGSLDEPLGYRASLRAIINNNAHDVELASGDIVYVTQEWTSHLGEVLERVSPLLSDPGTLGLGIALASQAP